MSKIFSFKHLSTKTKILLISTVATLGLLSSTKEASAITNGGLSLPQSEPKKAKFSGNDLVPAKSWPRKIKIAVAAANSINHKPYIYGGGHRSFKDRGYDCSGAVSYVLNKAGVLASPLASGALMQWGRPGKGKWLTVYSNPGHAFMVIAGYRFDTSGRGQEGPRWRKEPYSTKSFKSRTLNIFKK